MTLYSYIFLLFFATRCLYFNSYIRNPYCCLEDFPIKCPCMLFIFATLFPQQKDLRGSIEALECEQEKVTLETDAIVADMGNPDHQQLTKGRCSCNTGNVENFVGRRGGVIFPFLKILPSLRKSYPLGNKAHLTCI